MRLLVMILGLLFANEAALAATVRIEGGTAILNQGLATSRAGFITEERFAGAGCTASSDLTYTLDPGSDTNNYVLATDSVQYRRLNPLNDNSCYLTVGADDGNPAGQITVAFPLDPGGSADPLRYIGFYWGSYDEYSLVGFRDGLGNDIAITQNVTGTALTDFLLSGQQVSDAFATPLYQSIFIEFEFAETERPRQMILQTSNWAFELDNIA